MNRSFIKVSLIAAPAMLLLTGCFDDKYDLSDIDTTTQVQINDLVLPVNLKSVTLDNVIDVDENDPDATIKYVTVDGKQYFAIEKHGTFHSDPSTIEPVKAPEPSDIAPIVQSVNATGAASGSAASFALTADDTRFTYEIGRNGSDPVDESIITIQDVKMDTERIHILITLSSPSAASTASSVEYTNLKLTIPEGMKGVCSIENSTVENGLVTVPYLRANGNSATIEIVSDDLDFRPEYGEDGIKVIDGAFDYSSTMGIQSGTMTINYASAGSVQTTADFRIDYEMSNFVVTMMSGDVEYETDIANIDPVTLGDLPDFLAGDQTNLIMHNPQLELKVNNPAGNYNLGCESGLTIKSVRDDVVDGSQTLPGNFFVGYDKGEGPYDLVIAPEPDKAVNIANIAAADKFTFEGLRMILAGNGIPERLDIELSSTDCPEPLMKGRARNLPLGHELSDVDGTYTFLTLLAFDDGSQIVYDKVDDDWFDSDSDDSLSASLMRVSGKATSDLPCGVTLWIRPVDKNGNDIDVDNPDEATTYIAPMAAGEAFDIELRGTFHNINGIHYVATAKGFNGSAIMPEQNIKLDDVAIKLTGNYTTEF